MIIVPLLKFYLQNIYYIGCPVFNDNFLLRFVTINRLLIYFLELYIFIFKFRIFF
jgi:hypothetical protein